MHTKETFREEFSEAVLRLTNLHARKMAHHDFVAITNHAYLLEDWMWEVTLEVADEFTEDGVFVSFPAFEWTASNYCGQFCSPVRADYPAWGHRNVYFRNSEVATGLLRCTDPDYDSPLELFGALPAPDLVTTIPHATASERHAFDWSTLNPDYDRVLEIVQHTGDYEADVVENGWSAGYILGAVAGSDNHSGAAGTRQGVTAILAPELTRDALFDALLSRHTYATTHGDILLHFFGDGEIQGSVLSARTSVTLSGEIECENAVISLVELVDNGEPAVSWQPQQASSLRFESVQQVGEDPHYFYVRVTLDNGHRAWSSPIWVNYAASTSPHSEDS